MVVIVSMYQMTRPPTFDDEGLRKQKKAFSFSLAHWAEGQ
jgi:hypothetical protein